MDDYQHPLLNSLIVSQLAAYLSYEDKKKHRLVCQVWNEEIGKIIRKTSTVKIVLQDGKRLEDLLCSPCSTNFCSGFFFGPGVDLDVTDKTNTEKSANIFFRKYGLHVKSLSIINCMCTIENLKEILFHSCPNLETLTFVAIIAGRLFAKSTQSQSERDTHLLPNLKVLHLNVRSSDLIRNTEFMVDLLGITPNVETVSWLKLAHDEVSYDRNFQLDLEKAWSVQQPADCLTIRDTIYDVAIHHRPLGLPRLSSIESSMRLNNTSVLALRDRHFPLKYLDIRLTMDVYGASLKTLLEGLSGTLKALKIEFYPSLLDIEPSFKKESAKITHGNFAFPKMDKLEHLFLKTFFGSFKFLTEMKSLKTLSFYELDIRDCLTIIKKDVALNVYEGGLSPSLQLFQVFSEDTYSPFNNDKEAINSAEDVAALGKAFPNAKEIQVRGSLFKKRKWLKSFSHLVTLGEAASEDKIGGLKGPNADNDCCYCCAHKLQRLTWSFR